MINPLVPAGNPGRTTSILLASVPDLQAASNAGYRYLGQQGYVYGWCAAGPGCNVPEGSETLYLKCNAAVQDCAVFLQSQRTAFEARGYTVTFPGAVRPELGFAYPVADADGDTLPDAMERLLGTALNLPDSDGDGQSDAAEYPLGTAPVSDPCAGPNVRCTRAADRVFRSGFE